MRTPSPSVAVLFLGFGVGAVSADSSLWTTYQTPEAFLAEAFGTAPAPKLLELDGNLQGAIASTLGHNYSQGRLRYWRANGKSAWIFDDLGKPGYQLTTAGFVVKGGAIDTAKVLIYRESRGEQVAEASFLQQFAGAHLAGATLDKHIDGISGATLSANMMQRMASTALKLDAVAPQ